MRVRITAIVVGGAAALIAAFGVLVASAAGAGPPPPTSPTGKPVHLVASGVSTPTSFAFGAGRIFEGDGGSHHNGPPNGGVFLLSGGGATKLAGSPGFVAGLAWHKGALYLSGGSVTGKNSATWTLQKWSGFNGTTFAKRTVLYTAPKKFDGFNGIAFGPNGRLYVGVDLGLTNGNDHGPAKTPYVYDILSFKPNGKDLKVFASGIRQPWQMAFPNGSNSPYVSDLGQDTGAKNPPDFVLRVHSGDNYGFPQCNRVAAATCAGFSKPFKLFKPHTNIMGMVIIGSQLYMTSFAGPGAKGPGGEVLAMPLKGGKTHVVLSGFVAPTVGLGAHAGTLYVGELTGQVFSVTP